MPIAEALGYWQHKHPFTTPSCSLTSHFYWKSLQLLYLPNPIYCKQHSSWHSWDVWFNCIQKPEPVAPPPLVQGSCHESFLLILSLSRLQLQWHTHEICASLYAKWEQQHLILPRSRGGRQGLKCLWILPGSSEVCPLPRGETPTGASCPMPWWGGGSPWVPADFPSEEEEQAVLQMGPGHQAASQRGRAASQCMVRMITQLRTSILQHSSQQGADFPVRV